MHSKTETVGCVARKYEPFRFNGQSVESILIAHSYRKYVRANPNNQQNVSGHGGTSKFAQWKLHAMSKNIFKLQNVQSGKYLRIINNGETVDVGGGGGKYTLFRTHQHNPSTNNNMVQAHMISLESIQFPGLYVAVNAECNVYSFNTNNLKQNQNKNDICLYLYARPHIFSDYEQKQRDLPSSDVLKPGIVVIEHEFNKHLRVQPGYELNANGDGGRGKFARWELQIDGLNLIKFKSTKSGKYLRIINNGNICNVGGGGGEYTLFKYDPINKTLESNKFGGHYLAMNKHNKSDVFAVNKESKNNGDYFYQFNIIHLDIPVPDKNNNDNKDIVVLQHGFNKHLRVKPGNEQEINGNGGRGKFARWNVEYFDNGNKIKLKSIKSGKYLRIIKNGSSVDVGGSGGAFTLFKWDKYKKTLESNKFPGFYLAVNQQNNTVIAVQPQSVINNMNISMQINIIKVNDNNHSGRNKHNGFNDKYNFNDLNNSNTTMVVVRSESNGKSLRVKPGELEISNSLGGFGGFARWKISNHGNGIYKLQSTKTGKFIRISPKNNGGAVDVRGSGGKYTQFRVHLVRDENVIMLESIVFPNKYLASDMNGNVYVYNGNNNININNNKECIFKVLMQQNNGKEGRHIVAVNNNDQSALIQSQQQLIEQQKVFIDQLQKTVQSQQVIIDNLRNNNNNDNIGYEPGYQHQQSSGQQNIYPVLQSNINMNDNGTQTMGNHGEFNDVDDEFEYVSNPGGVKK